MNGYVCAQRGTECSTVDSNALRQKRQSLTSVQISNIYTKNKVMSHNAVSGNNTVFLALLCYLSTCSEREP